MGLGAAVLVAAAVPVGAFFGRLDAGRTHPGGAEALASMPTGLVSFAPGLIGFGLVALLTRALYVRGRPGHAGRWVAAGWLVAGAGAAAGPAAAGRTAAPRSSRSASAAAWA